MKKRQLLHLIALAAIVLSAATSPGAAEAGSTVYVVGGNTSNGPNDFGTLDLSTGVFTGIGTLNLPTGDYIYGMGFDSHGDLFGLDSQSGAGGAHLWEIDIANPGSSTDLGAIGQTAIDATLNPATGTMYGLTQDAINSTLYTLNPPASSTNIVGPSGVSSNGLLAMNIGGQLYTTALDPNNNNVDLYSVNPTTGAATLIGDTGFYLINGMFVGSALYGFDQSGAIVTINLTTGVGTQVATYNLPNGDSILASAVLTSAAIPEPSSAVLGLIAVVACGSLGVFRRRPATPVV